MELFVYQEERMAWYGCLVSHHTRCSVLRTCNCLGFAAHFWLWYYDSNDNNINNNDDDDDDDDDGDDDNRI